MATQARFDKSLERKKKRPERRRDRGKRTGDLPSVGCGAAEEPSLNREALEEASLFDNHDKGELPSSVTILSKSSTSALGARDEHDQQLDRIHNLVKNLKDISVSFQEELQSQKEEIDELDEDAADQVHKSQQATARSGWHLNKNRKPIRRK